MPRKLLTLLLVMLFSSLSQPGFSANNPSANNETEISPYPGMRFKGDSTTQNGIKGVLYCSNEPTASIRQFYKKKFKGAFEIERGTAKGAVYTILLDITSPVNWRQSKRFIEITAHKDASECKTTVFITRVPKTVKQESGIDYLPDGLPVSKLEAPVEKAAPSPAMETPSLKEPEKPSNEIVSQKRGDERQWNYFGAGGFVNTLNPSGGPAVIFRPLKNIGVHGFYGFGTFTSYEIRGMYRFNRAGRMKPYVGAGFMHTERDTTVIGVDTTIEDNSFIIVGGAEIILSKKLSFYVDINANAIELETTVTSGSTTARATVEYSPVSIGAGLIFYLF